MKQEVSKDAVKALFKAIIEADEALVERLLRACPPLARFARAEEAELQPAITHWIYAQDTPLHAAAAGHRVEIVKKLLSAGADPKAAENHRGGSPLHYASDGCLESPSWSADAQVATIRALVGAGADVHSRDKNGAAALHRAVRTRCAAAVDCLLKSGADASAKNNSGSTALHLAVQNTGRGGSGSQKAKEAQREIIRLLLLQGARPDARDGNGRTVQESTKSEWMLDLLRGEPR